MQLFATVFALAAAAGALAADITVQVGANGLAFTPPSITAQNGDNVIFEFHAKNHSVTQSTFATPCSLMTTPATGVDSGFQPVASTATTFPTWNITISDSSAPLWFFCAQSGHCQSGMVFAINPTAAKSFSAFQAAAMAGTSAAASSVAGATASASVTAAATDSTLVVSASTAVGASPSAPAGSVVVNGTSFPVTQVGAATVTPAPAAATTGTISNSAMRMGASASSIVALAGLVAGLML
ncbi:hypothetical protein H0H93_010672 [Arthromyces matolae]|nr:hypothetical protein H0H93_010672 [Arthromyces matolae]